MNLNFTIIIWSYKDLTARRGMVCVFLAQHSHRQEQFLWIGHYEWLQPEHHSNSKVSQLDIYIDLSLALFWTVINLCFYFKIHGSSRLDITEFEETSTEHSIWVEESPKFIIEFGEFGFIRISLVELKIIIQDVDALWLK